MRYDQAGPRRPRFEESHMTADNVIFIQPLVALIAGIIILIAPRTLNYIVAAYLIIFGLTGLYPHLMG